MGNIEKFHIDNNPFPILYIDLTTRCNMKCNFCYMGGRDTIEDISIEYFEDICKRLPKRIAFRFLGGEPTLHPNFFKLIEIARQYKHFVSISSNGKKFCDKNFVKEMKKVGGIYSMNVNGGVTNREAYKIIDGEDCLDWKMEAINNLIESGMKYCILASIIMRGVNENIIPELLKLATSNKKTFRYIKLRSTLGVGRHVDIKPYSRDEFTDELLPKYFDVNKVKNKYSSKNPDYIKICKERKCCHYFVYDKFLNVSFIEFGTPRTLKCWKRGKPDYNYGVTHWFEEMNYNGKDIKISINE